MQASMTLKHRLLAGLWLTDSEAKIRGYSKTQHESIRALCSAAGRYLTLADDTTDANLSIATIPLYCDAIRCLVSAVAAGQDQKEDSTLVTATQSAEHLQAWADAGTLPKVPRRFADALSILKSSELIAVIPNARQQALERRAAVEELACWLRKQVEGRTVTELWAARLVRVGLLVAAVVGTLSWGLSALLAPKNLALHHSVQVSSQYPGTPDPRGATDGKVVGPFQAHTSIEQDPWIVVDLGEVRRLSKVVVYNRTDGLFGDALPLQLELSSNGNDFRVVDRRTEVFTGSNPWVFKTRSDSARFVRIHGHPGGYVVVTEIEALGR